ncbi:MAG: hypothetical protein ACRCSQ_08825, partial [Bacteroidales bacterium]
GEPLEDMYEKPAFVTGAGIVSFKSYAPLKHKPVNIHYYIPQGDTKTMPVLFVLPGVNRNAADYLKCWKSGADRKQVMVFALEFPTAYYSSEEYNEGGMMNGTSVKPESEWSFSIVEPVFDFIRAELKGKQLRYDLWGHSAGAQFVHRYLLFKPNASINRAVSANAGWYTVPDLDISFPYGLKDSPFASSGLQTVFEKQLIIQLGTADTNPDDPNLNHSPGAEAQGKHRYARGLHFWQKSLQAAAITGNLNWIKHEVADVAHDYVKMATDALELMY